MYIDTHTRMQACMHPERSISHKKKTKKQKEILPFGTTWMDLEGIMLNDFTYLKTLKKKKNKNTQNKRTNKKQKQEL